MDRLINENAVLSAIGEWIAHNEHTYTNATEYLRNRIKAIKTAEQEPTTKENLVVEDCISRKAVLDEFYEYFADDDLASIDDYENYTKIVKALPSIQPTTKENLAVEDCISRAELLKAVDTWDRFGCDAGSSKLVPIKDCYVPYIHYDDVVKAIKSMPSIQPKKGHWISDKYGQHCDQCGNGINTPYKFCPFCGADMREYTKE